MPVSPRWAAQRLTHLTANSDLLSSRGRKDAVKAVMRPADLVPMIRSEGISTSPTSTTESVLFSGRISSSTAG